MTTSLIFLVALQGFWLRNSYEKAHSDLLAETTRYVREAVSAVRDSMLFRAIQTWPPDSVTVKPRFDSTVLFYSGGKWVMPRLPRSENQVQIYVSSGAPFDSTKTVLRSLATQAHEGRFRGGARYTIRLRDDSLNMDSVHAHLADLLHRAGKEMEFTVSRVNLMPPLPSRVGEHRIARSRVRHDHSEKQRPLLSNELQTEWVQIDPMARYAADLSQVRPLLLKQIAPQILFSVFLTSLTGLSFLVMFRSIRSQQRLMALKNDFISNITHELKTPIATVSVALEALKNFKRIDDPKLTSEYLDIAQMELGRLSMLTEKVMTASLFDEHGVAIEREPVNMGEKAAAVLGSMKLVMDKAGAVVTLDHEGSDFVVRGSDVHLTNVLYNLLDNALKYSPGSPTIRMLIRDTGPSVQVSVTDQGIGISAEYQSRIFEKFFRVPSGDVHNTKGYGLGLSYVDQVVRKHGGTLAVASELGQGSTFTITLPKQV